MNNFFKKIGYKYSLRRITSKGRDLPVDAIKVIKDFIEDSQNISRKPLSHIFNMDESSIELDSKSIINILTNTIKLNYIYFNF